MSGQAQTTPIIVNASGSSAAGVAPHFELVVDNVVVGQGSATTTNSAAYTFNVSLVPGQAHDIQVVYDNDTVINGQDRNLYLQSISVGGNTVAATSSLEVYHAAGQGNLASNGNMYWNGSAEFKLPASDFPAPTPSPAPPSTPSAPSGPAFFVATNGSDGGDGSAAHPFATLAKAQAAMEGSTTHTTYVEGGTYNLSSTLALGSKDSGMSFLAYPGQTPVLDGGSAHLGTLISINGAQNVTLSGLSFANTASGAAAVSLTNTSSSQIVGNHFSNTGEALLLTGSSNNTVSGNEMDNSAQDAVEVKDGSNNNTLDSNLINGTGASNTTGGGFFLHGVDGNSITHNLVENTAGMGIGVENWDNTTINVGNIIEYNVVRNTSTQSQDSGAIYMLGRSHVNTQATIANNLVDGTGASGSAHTIGIYLDDSTSGVTVQNNIVRNIGTHGVEIHGGDNITVQNNVFDLGTTATSAVLFQAAPADTNPTNTMLNDNVTKNIIYGASASQTPYSYIAGGSPNISGNLYYNTSGATMRSAAPTADSNPTYGNPNFANASAGNYALQTGSAAGAIGFQSISQSQIGLNPTTAHWYQVP